VNRAQLSIDDSRSERLQVRMDGCPEAWITYSGPLAAHADGPGSRVTKQFAADRPQNPYYLGGRQLELGPGSLRILSIHERTSSRRRRFFSRRVCLFGSANAAMRASEDRLG